VTRIHDGIIVGFWWIFDCYYFILFFIFLNYFFSLILSFIILFHLIFISKFILIFLLTFFFTFLIEFFFNFVYPCLISNYLYNKFSIYSFKYYLFSFGSFLDFFIQFHSSEFCLFKILCLYFFRICLLHG
jgi:hypothetical protein